MTGKYAKLILVSSDNNNKFYEMKWDGVSPTLNATYGRIDSTATTIQKPYSQWERIINSKEKKGYKNVTDLLAKSIDPEDEAEEATYVKIKDTMIEKFIVLMKNYTDGLVKRTYSVKATSVTKAQIDAAQDFLNELKKIGKNKTDEINAKLLELYTVIPRYISHVKNHLLPNIDIDKVIADEQTNIDAMAFQVATLVKPKKSETTKKVNLTLLDSLGITMKETKGDKNIQYLLDQLKGKKIKGLFEINKKADDAVFENWLSTQKNKDTRFLLHGTKCSSVVPIIQQGLKIRPVGNYQFSGKVYGDGNYFSETCNKSLGYTGWDNDKVMFVYEVHIGNPYVYKGWYTGNQFDLSYKELQNRGFDSTFVESGNGLLNSEIIAYKEEQCTLRYIIWL